MNLNFLGTDAGFGKKNTSAWLVSPDNRLILIDCGATVFTELLKRGLLDKEWDGIDVIVTHLHLDHVGSLSQLGLFSYFNKKMPINVITKCKDIDTFLTITDMKQNDCVPGFPKVRYTRENLYDVVFIPAQHSTGIDSYGFYMPAFDEKQNGFVYTGDTISLDTFLPYLEKGKATKLYTDASISGGVHLKLTDNMNLLRQLVKDGIEVNLMHLDNKEAIKSLILNTGITIADCID